MGTTVSVCPQCSLEVTQLPHTLKQEDDRFKANLYNLGSALKLKTGGWVLEIAQG